jgi:predicted RNA polymerase sigma factor
MRRIEAQVRCSARVMAPQAEPTMVVRLVRAKRKIKAARIPYRVPGAQAKRAPARRSSREQADSPWVP